MNNLDWLRQYREMFPGTSEIQLQILQDIFFDMPFDIEPTEDYLPKYNVEFSHTRSKLNNLSSAGIDTDNYIIGTLKNELRNHIVTDLFKQLDTKCECIIEDCVETKIYPGIVETYFYDEIKGYIPKKLADLYKRLYNFIPEQYRHIMVPCGSIQCLLIETPVFGFKKFQMQGTYSDINSLLYEIGSLGDIELYGYTMLPYDSNIIYNMLLTDKNRICINIGKIDLVEYEYDDIYRKALRLRYKLSISGSAYLKKIYTGITHS